MESIQLKANNDTKLVINLMSRLLLTSFSNCTVNNIRTGGYCNNNVHFESIVVI